MIKFQTEKQCTYILADYKVGQNVILNNTTRCNFLCENHGKDINEL